MICFAFPLAHEAESVLKHCTQKEPFSIGGLRCTIGNYYGRRILVALVGMGQDQAARNTELIFDYFRLKAFVLAGYAGALVPQMKVGQVAMATNYSTENVVQYLRLLSGFDYAIFCTADEVVGTREKREQYARTERAQVVDMETEAVAAIVHNRDISFLAVRVISDDFAQALPTGALAAGFDPIRGRATPLRLLMYLATHFREITPFRKFVSGLPVARNHLGSFMKQLAEELPSSW
jgi:adenosylhomocysteine nucleosidase